MTKQKHSLLSKKIDIVFLILMPFLATMLSLFFKTNYLTTTMLFFGIPSLYLSFRNQHAIKKSLIFSFFFGLVAGFIYDYIAELNGAWFITKTIFPSRILGITPYEDLIWAFLIIYNIIMFYEHLLDKGKHHLKDTHIKYLVIMVIFVSIVFIMTYFINKNLFFLPYFYIKTGIFLIFIPTVSFLSFFPRLISKYLKTAVYFMAQAFMFELTALYLGQWGFNQQYIGWIQISKLKFPLEEFVFWMVLFSTCVLSYYEFFDDDRK